jgi:hypothetical protein
MMDKDKDTYSAETSLMMERKRKERQCGEIIS